MNAEHSEDGAGTTAPRISAAGRWTSTGFFVADQQISDGVSWSIQRPHDTVVVHLRGPITKLQTEQEGCGAAHDPPMPGEVWVIPEGDRYHAEAKGGRVRYAELHFDKGVVPAGVEAQPVRPRAGHLDAFLHSAVLRLHELVDSGTELADLAAESLLHSMALHFYNSYTEAAGRQPASSPSRLTAAEASRLGEYIADNLATPIRLERLAARAGMTTHELLPAFRAAFGTTPAQYVIEQRLRRARALLTTTRKRIATIAFEAGFSSHAHLTSVFRTRLGCSPSELRRNATLPMCAK